MKLRDEWLEFIHDRFPQWTARILVPIIVLLAIYTIVSNRPDILWVSVYAFVVILILLNALYVLLAQEKAPAIPSANERSALASSAGSEDSGLHQITKHYRSYGICAIQE